MQSYCFSFEQHLGRWAVWAAFHHAERAPRVTSSLTAESPTIQKLQNILGVDIGILATQVMRARKTRKWLGSLPRPSKLAKRSWGKRSSHSGKEFSSRFPSLSAP